MYPPLETLWSPCTAVGQSMIVPILGGSSAIPGFSIGAEIYRIDFASVSLTNETLGIGGASATLRTNSGSGPVLLTIGLEGVNDTGSMVCGAVATNEVPFFLTGLDLPLYLSSNLVGAGAYTAYATVMASASAG
jgi:hypothetical protein